MKSETLVLIVAHDRGEKCDAGCGVDWSSYEAVDLARRNIKEKFGAKIKLEYIDWSQADLELKSKVKDIPALVINGNPRISGRFDMRMLLDAIDAELEMGLEGG